MKKILKQALPCVMIALVIVGILYIRKDLENKPKEQTVGLQGKQAFNILLLGCDDSGARADSIMLVNVRPSQAQVRLLSLPRDSKIKHEGNFVKLGTMLSRGGNETMCQTVESLTGVSVDYFVQVRVGAFAEIVDALGGVQYTVEQDMKYSDPAQNLNIDLKAGEQLLSGQQCEQYCRYRQYVTGDLSRIEHQQKMAVALLRQKANLKTLVKAPALLQVLSEKCETDISSKEIRNYLPLLRQMAGQEVKVETYLCAGEINDMQKEGISYFLIDTKELKKVAKEKFTT